MQKTVRRDKELQSLLDDYTKDMPMEHAIAIAGGELLKGKKKPKNLDPFGDMAKVGLIPSYESKRNAGK